MTEHDDWMNLDNAQKTQLFSLGLSNGHDALHPVTTEKSDLLFNLLADRMPADQELLESLPPVLQRMHRELHALGGESLGLLLQQPETSLETLRRIKNYAKQYDKNAAEIHDVALIIYYASIAHGLVFHHEKITEYDLDKLREAFSTIHNQEWIPQNLQSLFDRAIQACDQIKSQSPASK